MTGKTNILVGGGTDLSDVTVYVSLGHEGEAIFAYTDSAGNKTTAIAKNHDPNFSSSTDIRHVNMRRPISFAIGSDQRLETISVGVSVVNGTVHIRL